MTTIGTQTFGLGKELSANLAGTIQSLHDMGFQAIEPFVLFAKKQGRLPRNIWTLETLAAAAEQIQQLGMTIPSVHIGVGLGWFSLPVGLLAKNIIKLREQYGIRDFAVSGMFCTLTGARRWAKFVRKLSDAVSPSDCRILYHNHDGEFQSVHGQNGTVYAMDAFLEAAGSDVMLQMDVGWAGMAGSEMAITKRYADKIASIHLKDFYAVYRNGAYNRRNLPPEAFAPIGAGFVAVRDIVLSLDYLSNFNGTVIIDQDKSSMDMLQALEIGCGNVLAMLETEGRS